MEQNKIPTMFRLDEDLIKRVRTIATIEKRSLNQQVAMFLENQARTWEINREKIQEYSADYEKEEGRNE